jgi:peptidoglycan/xylan/chitin deacetylase (PgdA/CDA1 family)
MREARPVRTPTTTRRGAKWPFQVTGDFAGLDPKSIALTIDDGPTSNTEDLLNTLDQLGIPGTFFVVGDRARRYPEEINSILEHGHSLGLHGWSHTRFPELAKDELRRELQLTRDSLPVPVSMVRPPYGDLDLDTLDWLVAEGFSVVGWSVYSEDWLEERTRESLAEEIAGDLAPGDILLMHDVAGSSELLYALIQLLSGWSISWTDLRMGTSTQ